MSSNLKNVSRYVLPSGLTILIETLPYVRSVALGYYLRSGSAVESEEHSGASHFLEHLVFKGTATRSTSDIAKVIDILAQQGTFGGSPSPQPGEFVDLGYIDEAQRTLGPGGR